MKPWLRQQHSIIRFAFGIGLLTLTLPAICLTINFDDLPAGTVVTNQYSAFATFSSSQGHENYAIPFISTPSQPNMLCSGAVGTPNCLEDTYIDFTQPLFDLNFVAVLQNSNSGQVAQLNIFEHGVHTHTQFVMGVGHPGNLIVSLLNYDFMTRLEIVNISAATGWDSFTLDLVPEAPTFVSLLFAIALCVSLIKKSR